MPSAERITASTAAMTIDESATLKIGQWCR
jgi:hypothetical protein